MPNRPPLRLTWRSSPRGIGCEVIGSRGGARLSRRSGARCWSDLRCSRAFSGPGWHLAAFDSWPDQVPCMIVARRAGQLAGVFPLARRLEGETVGFATLLSDY